MSSAPAKETSSYPGSLQSSVETFLRLENPLVWGFRLKLAPWGLQKYLALEVPLAPDVREMLWWECFSVQRDKCNTKLTPPSTGCPCQQARFCLILDTGQNPTSCFWGPEEMAQSVFATQTWRPGFRSPTLMQIWHCSVCLWSLHWRRRNGHVPGVHWPANLAKEVNSKFNERLDWNKQTNKNCQQKN